MGNDHRRSWAIRTSLTLLFCYFTVLFNVQNPIQAKSKLQIPFCLKSIISIYNNLQNSHFDQLYNSHSLILYKSSIRSSNIIDSGQRNMRELFSGNQEKKTSNLHKENSLSNISSDSHVGYMDYQDSSQSNQKGRFSSSRSNESRENYESRRGQIYSNSIKVKKTQTIAKNRQQKTSNRTNTAKLSKKPSTNKRPTNLTNIPRRPSNSSLSQLTFEEFEFMHKTFHSFGKATISFNEFVLALKMIGIQQPDKDNEAFLKRLKGVYEQAAGFQFRNEGIYFQNFTKIAYILLRQQKQKPNSMINTLDKTYQFLLEEASLSQKSHDSKDNRNIYELTPEALISLTHSLKIQKEISPADVEQIFSYCSSSFGEKQVFSREEFIRVMQSMRIFNMGLIQ